MKKRVVIVEDDFLIVTYLADCCEIFGFEVVGEARTADAAIAVIRETRPDFVLMDLRLQGKGDGVDAALAVRGELPDLKVVFVTGSSEPSSIKRIESADPHAILIKPVLPDHVRDALS